MEFLENASNVLDGVHGWNVVGASEDVRELSDVVRAIATSPHQQRRLIEPVRITGLRIVHQGFAVDFVQRHALAGSRSLTGCRPSVVNRRLRQNAHRPHSPELVRAQSPIIQAGVAP